MGRGGMARFAVTVLCVSTFATAWLAGPHRERRAAADVATAERKPPATETPPSDDDPLFHCKDHPARVMVTFSLMPVAAAVAARSALPSLVVWQ